MAGSTPVLQMLPPATSRTPPGFRRGTGHGATGYRAGRAAATASPRYLASEREYVVVRWWLSK
jgi:hypothetical protein